MAAETEEVKADTPLDYTPLDVEVSDFEEWKIKFGLMEDPRVGLRGRNEGGGNLWPHGSVSSSKTGHATPRNTYTA